MKISIKTIAVFATIIIVIACLGYFALMAGNSNRRSVDVAFVPVTCHLTCPVTDYATKTSKTGTVFNAQRFTAFPPIIEAMKAKRLEAAFLTVPLAMQMREEGAPVKICCLGHRNGSAIVVRSDLKATSIKDMKGKTIAIPSPYSNEYFILRLLMKSQGLKDSDINIVKMGPPDMMTALAAKAIDGYVVAEPFISAVVRNGTGRVLYWAKDLEPNYISCALVVHEDLIKNHPDEVKDLVRGIVDSGLWAQNNREEAAKLAAPYFRQNVSLLDYVLTHDKDDVVYTMLTPGDDEMQKIEDTGIELGILKKRIPMSELMDKRFIPEHPVPVKIDPTKLGTVPKAAA